MVRSSPLRTGRLYPQEFSWYSFLEAESTPRHMVPSVASEKKSPAIPLGIDPETLRLVAQCLNHYATPGPNPWSIFLIFIFASFGSALIFKHCVLKDILALRLNTSYFKLQSTTSGTEVSARVCIYVYIYIYMYVYRLYTFITTVVSKCAKQGDRFRLCVQAIIKPSIVTKIMKWIL
jgi:hypothetical protein